MVYELGEKTFGYGALKMAGFGGGYAPVPVDGWTQMVVYRKDLFLAHGLQPPTRYKNIVSVIEKLHNPPSMYGFVAATKVDENFMSQVLEHVLLAKGFNPVNKEGKFKSTTRNFQNLWSFIRHLPRQALQENSSGSNLKSSILQARRL